MRIAVIKILVEKYSYIELKTAEEKIAEGEIPAIEIEGEDEGEQLTHAYAAMEIKKEIEDGKDAKTALREFTLRVRNSLS